MAKKSLEAKLVELANELLNEKFKIYSENVEDGDNNTLPDSVEILLKEIDVTQRHLEQIAFLLKKYNKG